MSFVYFMSTAGALPCMTGNSQFKNFGQLVQSTHVIGNVDDRGELPSKVKDLGLSKNMVKQLRTSLGVLYCPPDRLNPEPAALTAFLAENTGEIVSAGHAIVDAWGTTRDLSACYFENFELPKPRRIYIDAKSSRNLLPTTNPSADNNRNDKIRLALKSRVPGAKPFSLDNNGGDEPGTPVILAAAQLRDFKGSGMHPIVGSCMTMGAWELNDGQGRFRTNCNEDKGGSGGPVLVKRGDELMVKGIVVHGPSDLRDNLPYSEANSVINLTLGHDFLR